MRRILFALAVVLVAMAFATGSVAAQDGNESAVEAEPACENPDQIDRTIRLCSADLDGGEAVLVFESDREQTITLSDMADTLRRGEIDQRDVTLASDDRTTVRWSVSTTDEGLAGVSVATDRVLYSVPLKDERPLIGGPWTAEDTQLAVLVALTVGSIVTTGVVWRRSSGADMKSEREA